MNRDAVPVDTESAGQTAARGTGVLPVVRAAVPEDAEGIIRLRSELILSTPLDEEWIGRCSTQLALRLGPGGDARAFVIDASDGGLAAVALGLIHAVLPAPSYPQGLAARVQAVATRPGFRRRGFARAVLSALLDELKAGDVTLFELHSSPEATPLYRELGFASNPALMRMTWHGQPAQRSEEEKPAPWMPPEQYAETLMKATGFACAFFTDEHDRPVQLHSVYSSTHPWQMAGGTMEIGERPWQTAVRECREETGLRVQGPPRILATVFGLPGAEWPYSTMGCIFDGGRLTEAQIKGIVLDRREHDEVGVLTLAEWQPLMPPRDFARLSAVLEARRSGVAAYFDAWDWGNE
ncbi:GNAT family N-acetyltransferase [Streptomyces graminilatus]|uniref:GNAT family N-acetyltransferase n=1 Tax=Streptomyces graminilatus TaxID=1464070 RepID=UPI000B0D0CB0|nr:GNAT family N-acetyltransferase [Streptomyces graminilatus]